MSEWINELHHATIQETGSSVKPGESASFRSALKRLDALSNDDGSFSHAAWGEIRRLVAMVQVMHIGTLEPGSKAEQEHHAYLKRDIPTRIRERMSAFDAIRQKDCAGL